MPGTREAGAIGGTIASAMCGPDRGRESGVRTEADNEEDDGMLKRKKFWVVLAGVSGSFCLFACVAFLALSGLGTLVYDLATFERTVGVGREAPEFDLVTLSGDRVRLRDFRGRPVVLTFSATWCPDCVREIPLLQSIHQRHPGLTVLLIDSREDAGTVQAFVDRHGLTFPIALDGSGAVARRYHIYAIPSVFFVDANGIIQTRLIELFSAEQLDQSLASVGVAP